VIGIHAPCGILAQVSNAVIWRGAAQVGSREADGSAVSTERRSVLIIEDDLDVRTVLLAILGRTYDVAIADNGATALSRFESGERFDVILCDVLMPRMDGPALIEHLIRIAPEQARRVIVLTANVDSPEAARLADHHVVEKPFNVRHLRELIAQVST